MAETNPSVLPSWLHDTSDSHHASRKSRSDHLTTASISVEPQRVVAQPCDKTGVTPIASLFNTLKEFGRLHPRQTTRLAQLAQWCAREIPCDFVEALSPSLAIHEVQAFVVHREGRTDAHACGRSCTSPPHRPSFAVHNAIDNACSLHLARDHAARRRNKDRRRLAHSIGADFELPRSYFDRVTAMLDDRGKPFAIDRDQGIHPCCVARIERSWSKTTTMEAPRACGKECNAMGALERL